MIQVAHPSIRGTPLARHQNGFQRCMGKCVKNDGFVLTSGELDWNAFLDAFMMIGAKVALFHLIVGILISLLESLISLTIVMFDAWRCCSDPTIFLHTMSSKTY